mmetsp:Transcript_8039/g.13498  ORF Transcript_8039/g.13498 Transcript_8039/m.13498 type:complete len:157 (-) Transcript_8039:108-578(-)
MQRIEGIKDQNFLAEKLELLKLNNMNASNPKYTLSRVANSTPDKAKQNPNYTLSAEDSRRNESKEGAQAVEPGSGQDDQASTIIGTLDFDNSRKGLNNVENLKRNEFMFSLKRADDFRSLFSEDQLSTLTLEQKILSGIFNPKKARSPSNQFSQSP